MATEQVSMDDVQQAISGDSHIASTGRRTPGGTDEADAAAAIVQVGHGGPNGDGTLTANHHEILEEPGPSHQVAEMIADAVDENELRIAELIAEDVLMAEVAAPEDNNLTVEFEYSTFIAALDGKRHEEPSPSEALSTLDHYELSKLVRKAGSDESKLLPKLVKFLKKADAVRLELLPEEDAPLDTSAGLVSRLLLRAIATCASKKTKLRTVIAIGYNLRLDNNHDWADSSLPASLQTLNLSFANLGDGEMEALAEKLPEGLEKLDLSNNRITSKGVMKLASGVRGLDRLKRLNLSGNEFGGDRERAVLLLLVCNLPGSLRELVLGNCNLSSSQFAAYLPEGLQRLDVADNRLWDAMDKEEEHSEEDGDISPLHTLADNLPKGLLHLRVDFCGTKDLAGFVERLPPSLRELDMNLKETEKDEVQRWLDDNNNDDPLLLSESLSKLLFRKKSEESPSHGNLHVQRTASVVRNEKYAGPTRLSTRTSVNDAGPVEAILKRGIGHKSTDATDSTPRKTAEPGEGFGRELLDVEVDGGVFAARYNLEVLFKV